MLKETTTIQAGSLKSRSSNSDQYSLKKKNTLKWAQNLRWLLAHRDKCSDVKVPILQQHEWTYEDAALVG